MCPPPLIHQLISPPFVTDAWGAMTRWLTNLATGKPRCTLNPCPAHELCVWGSRRGIQDHWIQDHSTCMRLLFRATQRKQPRSLHLHAPAAPRHTAEAAPLEAALDGESGVDAQKSGSTTNVGMVLLSYSMPKGLLQWPAGVLVRDLEGSDGIYHPSPPHSSPPHYSSSLLTSSLLLLTPHPSPPHSSPPHSSPVTSSLLTPHPSPPHYASPLTLQPPPPSLRPTATCAAADLASL